MQNDFGSSFEIFFFELADLECSWAITFPATGLFALNFRDDFNQISNDKGGVEANTELTNDVIFGISTFKTLNKLFRSTFGYGS